MIKGLNKLIAAGILTTSAVTATVAPATKVNAETIVSVGKNTKYYLLIMQLHGHIKLMENVM